MDNTQKIPTSTTACTITPTNKPVLLPPTSLQTLPVKTNLTKPPFPLTLLALPAPLLVPTLIPRTQFFPHSLTSSYPHPNSQQPSSPRHNLTRQHTAVQLPSHPPLYYHQKEQPIAKIEPNTDDKFSFLFEKIMNLQHQLDNTAGAIVSSKRRKQVYWGKTRINQ